MIGDKKKEGTIWRKEGGKGRDVYSFYHNQIDHRKKGEDLSHPDAWERRGARAGKKDTPAACNCICGLQGEPKTARRD